MIDFALDAIDTTAKSEAGVEVTLQRLDGSTLLNAKKKPVTLTLVGADSKAYRRATRLVARARTERRQHYKGDNLPDEELDALETDLADLLAAATVGWSGVLDSAGKEIPFSSEAAKELFARFPIAREQADRAIGDRARFTKAS